MDEVVQVRVGEYMKRQCRSKHSFVGRRCGTVERFSPSSPAHHMRPRRPSEAYAANQACCWPSLESAGPLACRSVGCNGSAVVDTIRDASRPFQREQAALDMAGKRMPSTLGEEDDACVNDGASAGVSVSVCLCIVVVFRWG